MNPIDRQTVAYAFTATDSFDGSTEAPETRGPDAESQFYAGVAAEIGLFPVNDPSEEEQTTSRGNRWLTWLEIRLDAPAPAGSKLEIVDNTSIPGTPVVLKEVRDYSGESLVYLEVGTLVPQGAVLRLNGGSGVFRYHITFLEPQGLSLLASLAINTQGGDGDVDQCPAYVVSQDGNCPYTSINGAQAAALADGRGPDSPAVILVQPGIYAEAVNLEPGISVQGRPSARRGGVFLLGSITYAAAAASDGNTSAIVGLIIFPQEGGTALTFGGSVSQELNVVECLIVGAGPEPTVVNSNTDSDSELLADYVDVAQFTPGALAYQGSGAAPSDFSNYILFQADVTQRAVEVLGAAELTLSDGTIIGQLAVSDSANVVVFDSVVQSSGQPGVLTTTTGGMFAAYTAIAVDGATYAVDGDGQFGYAALTVPGVGDMAPTLNGAAGAAVSDLYFQNGPNARTVFASDTVRTDDNVLLVDTSAGDVTLTLRLAANYRPGRAITIKKITDDMNTVILTTTGGQLLDGIATGLSTDIYREALTFVSDGVSGFWLVSEGLQQFDLSLAMFTEESLIAPITSYYGGFYIFAPTDNAGAPIALGGVSQPTGAFAFFVTGTVPGGAETVTLTGTSVDDLGNRVPGDSEIIAVGAGTPVNSFFQSTKRWVGSVTFTPTGGLTFNAGFVAFQSEGETNFTVRFIDASWQTRGATATPDADIALVHHRATGWTFNAGSEPTPPPPIASMRADYTPDNVFTPPEYGSWRRDGIGTVVLGNLAEGVFLRVEGSSAIVGTATIRIEQ